MTNYTDVIPLERAKLYLKVDASQTETENPIASLYNLLYSENRHNTSD